MNLATSCVESLITRNDLKKREPIVNFKEICKYGFMALEKITMQTQ